MKRLVVVLVVLVAFSLDAQNNSELLKHYKAYYEQMRTQGDVQGVINALTHLNIIQPSQERKDTLAVLYMNQGMHLQALNTIGIEKNATDSDMAVEVKAVCLQALNQLKRSIEHYEELFKRSPNILIAYELADLKLQTEDLTGAYVNIEYGIANDNAEVMRTYYETQSPYQVPAKAAFLYLKSLAKFKEDKTTKIDEAIAALDEALVVAPNFNLAQITKNAMEAQKQPAATKDN